MPKLAWDEVGKRFYETGIDHGVLYLPNETGKYTNGVVWNGLVSVSESPSGAEANAQYADNIKYLNLYSVEEFGATIEAFTYPEEFEACDGSAEVAKGVYATQQTRKSFGLSYRTLVGNDLKGTDYGYKIHLVYGAMATPSEKARSTVNESPEAVTFSWELTTTPMDPKVAGFKPTAHIVVDSTKTVPAKLTALEDKLYGTNTLSASLPTPDEVFTLMRG